MPRGGARLGAGRPKGQGKYREPTKPIRIPESLLGEVIELISTEGYSLPLYSCAVQAGFPSPADDHIEGKLDLNKYLIKHPTATFFVRAAGDSMVNAGIHSGDILVVDRSIEARHKSIVIADIDGSYTCKRLLTKPRICLASENDKYDKIFIKEGEQLGIYGVVIAAINIY